LWKEEEEEKEKEERENESERNKKGVHLKKYRRDGKTTRRGETLLDNQIVIDELRRGEST